MAECRRAEEWISAALDGELTAEEARALEAHLTECPACRALAADLARLHGAMAGMEPARAVPPELHEKILSAAAREPRPGAKKRRTWRTWAALAACAVLAVGVWRFTAAPAQTPEDGGIAVQTEPYAAGGEDGARRAAGPEAVTLPVPGGAQPAAAEDVCGVLTLPASLADRLPDGLAFAEEETGVRRCTVDAETFDELVSLLSAEAGVTVTLEGDGITSDALQGEIVVEP